ncbi:MAG: hypothetical protein AAF968_22590 [Pseudomonadota bacterium]
MRQSGLFGFSDHLKRLSKDGDTLEVLEATVDFEHFRSWLVEGLGYGDGSKGGRPPFDPVFELALGPVAGWRPHCSRR